MNMGVNHSRIIFFGSTSHITLFLFTSNGGILVLGLTPVGRDAIGMRHVVLRGIWESVESWTNHFEWKSLNEYSSFRLLTLMPSQTFGAARFLPAPIGVVAPH